jgi:hypothetical protein
MSINTKSRTRRALRHWRKALVVLGVIVLAPSTPLFFLYIGFWIGRWTYGLKVIKTKKSLNTQIVPYNSEESLKE